MPKRLSHAEIKKQVEDSGYKLVSTSYERSTKPLTFQCTQGHTYTTVWAKFQQGGRCSCERGGVKLSIDYIREQVEKEGFKLVSSEYVSAREKLELVDPYGRVLITSWNEFKNGNRQNVTNRILPLSEVKHIVESKNYKLLSTEYNGARSRILIECSNGHVNNTTLPNFKKGKIKCKSCSDQALAHSYNDVKEYVESQNYQLESKIYVNSKEKLHFLCDKGHKYITTLDSFKSKGARCHVCNNSGFSRAEKELVETLKALLPDVIMEENTRKIISPYELDIYLPEYKIAIEYCGLFWHSAASLKKSRHMSDKTIANYHKMKHEGCAKKGIRLITIFEDEWLEQRELCLNKIMQRIKRPLDVISNNYTMVQTLDTIELTQDSYNPGGLTITDNIQYAMGSGVKKIRIHCDLRWENGDLYKALGFNLAETLPPKVYHTRQGIRTKFDQSNTDPSFSTIYDCGHQVWEYSIC